MLINFHVDIPHKSPVSGKCHLNFMEITTHLSRFHRFHPIVFRKKFTISSETFGLSPLSPLGFVGLEAVAF